MNPPRLDILLYAHDGRGLGHISRSVGIGMALRRLYPELKVCLITGSRITQELIGPVPLDWLKLPSYETEVVDGKSRGIDGYTNYSDGELKTIRQEQIRQILSLYRPRLLLADHTPQGKHQELANALGSSEATEEIRCVLGMRGVVGAVSQAESPLALQTFERYYTGLLWYGDSRVTGEAHKELLGSRFSTSPQECGYVSRLRELRRIAGFGVGVEMQNGCTVSVPWIGEHTERFLGLLIKVLSGLGQDFGPVRIFAGEEAAAFLRASCGAIGNCSVEPFGTGYVKALFQSRAAIIFGGYNSLVDVLSADVPAMVVLRDMQDQEQQVHVDALRTMVPDRLAAISEKSCSVDELHHSLAQLLETSRSPSMSQHINLDGAERAARALANYLH